MVMRLYNPGAWFCMAGFCKIASLTMAMGTFPYGGIDAWLVTVPFAIGLAALGRYLDRDDVIRKKFFPLLIMIGGIAALFVGRTYCIWEHNKRRGPNRVRQKDLWEAATMAPFENAAQRQRKERRGMEPLAVLKLGVGPSDQTGLGFEYEPPAKGASGSRLMVGPNSESFLTDFLDDEPVHNGTSDGRP